jgi:hypothetical protein
MKKDLLPGTLDNHRRWKANNAKRLAGRMKNDNDLPCMSCACIGNCECGHAPLAAPEHNCELDPETLGCYCCKMLEDDNA